MEFFWNKKKGDNLSEKAKRGETLVINPDMETNQLQQIIYKWLVNGQVPKYEASNETYIMKGYKWNPHAYTVINYLCKQASQVPFYSYEVTNRKALYDYISYKSEGRFEVARMYSKKAMKIVEKGGLAQVLERPNANQGWSQYMFSKFGYRKLTGNAYTYGQTPEGYPEDVFGGLYVAPSQIITPVMGDWKKPIRGFQLNYGYAASDEIPFSKFLHQKEWNPEADQNGPSPLGQSPMEALKRSLQRSNESYDANTAMLKNGGPAGVLSNKSGRVMQPKEVEEQKKSFDKKFAGGKNVNQILHAATDLSWEAIGLSPVDLDLLESNKADLGDFCRAYGIDIIIFDQDQSSYNNKKTAKKALWEDTMIPECNLERDDLNRWLAAPWSEFDGREYYIDYDLSKIPALQIDRNELSARLREEQKLGWWTPNQCRQMMGEDADEDNEAMSRHYIDSSLRVLGMETNPGLQLLLGLPGATSAKIIEAMTPEQRLELLKTN